MGRLRQAIGSTLALAIALASVCLLLGELAPFSVLIWGEGSILLDDWQFKEVVLISTLTLLSLLLGRFRRSGGEDSTILALRAFHVLNVVPLVATALTTIWVRLSDNCPFRSEASACNYLSLVLDNLGLTSARLARLDLGVTLLLSSRGKSAFLRHVTGGALGFTEAVPLHRAAGWWCIGQSAIHSIAYLVFYFYQGGGWRAVWDYCFPVPMRARLNSLGLVNFFGLVAFLPLAVLLAVFALNWVRRSDYSVFQRMHLPLGLLFVLFCALHDLPILLFAAPGLADWFFGWRFEGTAARTMPARVRVLKGTSGPWVEVTLDCAGDMAVEAAVAASKGDSSSSKNGSNAIREQWVSISFPEHLGKESHPFSIASLSSTELSVLVSAGAGDWTSRLATLSSKVEQATVSGPFPGGEGIDRSFGRLIENEEEKEDEEAGKDRQPESNTRLLLIVGGTGICGWLPALQAMKEDRAPSHAKIRLAWLVQTEADYTALAQRLPCSPIMDVTIFITRPSTTTTKQNLGGEEMDLIQSKNNGKEIPLCGRKSYGEREGKGSFTVVTGHQLGTTWASFPFVSLTAALVGLVVQHYLWRGWLISLLSWSRHGMITYTLVYRTLPIALILGCMAATIALGSRFMQQPSHPSVTRLGDSSYQRVGSFCEDQTQTGDGECPTNACEQMPVKEPDHDSPSNGISNQMESKVALEKEGKRCSSSSGLHEVRLGRPDIAALVRETAAGLPLSRQGQGAPARLVVAVCGPPNMVIATRKVVKATQQSSACKHICLQFSGSDSRW